MDPIPCDNITEGVDKKQATLYRKKVQDTVEELALEPQLFCDNIEAVTDACQSLNQYWYITAEEERFLAGVCGYPLCDKDPEHELKQSFRIRSDGIYNVECRRWFCSDHCYAASRFIANQLPPEPLWITGPRKPLKLKFHPSIQAPGDPVITTDQLCEALHDLTFMKVNNQGDANKTKSSMNKSAWQSNIMKRMENITQHKEHQKESLDKLYGPTEQHSESDTDTDNEADSCCSEGDVIDNLMDACSTQKFIYETDSQSGLAKASETTTTKIDHAVEPETKMDITSCLEDKLYVTVGENTSADRDGNCSTKERVALQRIRQKYFKPSGNQIAAGQPGPLTAKPTSSIRVLDSLPSNNLDQGNITGGKTENRESHSRNNIPMATSSVYVKEVCAVLQSWMGKRAVAWIKGDDPDKTADDQTESGDGKVGTMAVYEAMVDKFLNPSKFQDGNNNNTSTGANTDVKTPVMPLRDGTDQHARRVQIFVKKITPFYSELLAGLRLGKESQDINDTMLHSFAANLHFDPHNIALSHSLWKRVTVGLLICLGRKFPQLHRAMTADEESIIFLWDYLEFDFGLLREHVERMMENLM